MRKERVLVASVHFAAFFTFMTIILGYTVAISMNFVNAYIIKSLDEIDDDHLIAGVGVFNAYYDPTTADPNVVRKSGIPIKTFETKSEDFPLLFPSQENFMEQLLPIGTEFAKQLDTNFQDEIIGPILPTIEEAASPVEGDIFRGCEPYYEIIEETLPVYFAQFQEVTLPRALAVLTNAVAEAKGVQGVDRPIIVPAVLIAPTPICDVIEDIDDGLIPEEGCNFITSLEVLALLIRDIPSIQNILSDRLENFAFLYRACIEPQDGLSFSFVCPNAFALQFPVTAVSSSFELDIDTFGDTEPLFEDVVRECELDEIDNLKMRKAQKIYIVATTLNTLAFVISAVHLVLHKKNGRVRTRAILSGVLSVVLFLGALSSVLSLTTIRSAPVYDIVGLEPNGVDLEPIFLEGVIPYVSGLSTLFGFIACLMYLVYWRFLLLVARARATVFSMKHENCAPLNK